MNLYRVAQGIATIGAGVPLSLDEQQLKRRAHNIEGKPEKNGKRFDVVGRVPLQFKTGEIVGLAQLPKSMVETLVPEGKPKSEADKVAVAKEAERKAEKPGFAARAIDKITGAKPAAEPRAAQTADGDGDRLNV